jgi:hypothetical protein
MMVRRRMAPEGPRPHPLMSHVKIRGMRKGFSRNCGEV